MASGAPRMCPKTSLGSGFRLYTLMQAALHFFTGEPRLMSAGAGVFLTSRV